MAQGVRGGKQALIHRFHVGERLAVRAVALLSRQVDLTAAVLESASPGSSIEKTLLHPKVLSSAESLTSETLREIELEGSGAEPTLAVQLAEGWRTIALEEELLAEQAARPEQELDVSQLPARVDPYQLVDASEMVELFTPAEITGLKVTLLTSADPSEKITALRKLLLSSASPRQKGAILITALADAAPEVRAEAAAGLTRLGLNPGIADAAQALATGSKEQKEFAAGELGRLVHAAKPVELPILLTVLASALESEKEDSVRRALVAAAREAAPYAAAQPEQARELARILLRQVRGAERELWPEVRSAVARLGEASPQAVAELIREEIDKAPEGAVRRFLLTLLGAFPRPPGMDEMLAEQIVSEAARGRADELELQSLTDQVAMIGEPAVARLCEQFERAHAERRPALVRMLDAVCARSGVSAESKNRAGALFARALRTADRHLRATLLETVLPVDPELSPGVRTALAEELLASLVEFRHPRIAAEVESKVARMGAAAIEPLLKRLQPSVREEDQLTAARALAMLVPRLTEGEAPSEKAAREALDGVLGATGKARPKAKGELIRCAGRLAASPTLPPSRAEALSRQLKAELRDSECPYAILEALAQIARHPHVPMTTEIDTAETFLGFLQEELPDLVPEGQPADQEVIELGRQASAYTEMVPILLRGLKGIFTKTRSAQLRNHIAKVLLDRWTEASEWRLLWGPGNTVLLLEVLGSLGADASTADTLRLAILDSLMNRVDFPPAVRALGEVCHVQTGSRSLGERAGRVARRMLERLAQRSAIAEDEADVIYGALGKIAGRQRLGQSDRQGQELRGKILTALFEGLREGWRGAAAGLQHAADSGELPADVLADVQTRLQDFHRTRGGRANERP